MVQLELVFLPKSVGKMFFLTEFHIYLFSNLQAIGWYSDVCMSVCTHGGGGTHILRHTGMCRSNGSLFHKKSLNMAPISYIHIQIPPTGNVSLMLRSIAVVVPLWVLWKYYDATVTGVTAHPVAAEYLHSTLKDTHVAGHSGQKESRCVNIPKHGSVFPKFSSVHQNYPLGPYNG